MPRRLLISSCSLLAWAATLLVVATPLLLGADSGGVLPWTQWAAAGACLLAVCLAAPACVLHAGTAGWRPHLLAVLLLLLAGYGGLQVAALPTAALSLLAPGSLDAYSGWLSPLARVAEDAVTLEAIRPKISLDAALTRSAVWLTLLLAGFALLASHLLIERRRIELLLIVFAATGAVHAGLGIYQLLTAADATVWGIRSHYGGKPFGAFVNRSNAAVLLNLALGSSLGLIGWRLAALTGTPLNGQRFPLNELFDIVLDRIAIFAFLTASVSLVGLLTCGARSGLVGLVGGLLLALGMVQSANKLRGLIATGVALGLMTGIMVVNLDLTAVSAKRVGATAEQWLEAAPGEDARWAHWQDATRAALHQPLFGWGWGAYRYAYLPFQRTSSGAWFHNADNLWLEMFVETGVLGLALIAFAIGGIIAALRRLGQSVDPIDHGLVVAGWFGLGASASSQLFDFGLRIPANAVMAGILFSAVIARACFLRHPERSAQTQRAFPFFRPLSSFSPARSLAARYPRASTLATLGIAMCWLAVTADALARQAISDKLLRTARYALTAANADVTSIETAASDLQHHLQQTAGDTGMWSASSQLTWRLARLHAAVALEQQVPPQALRQQLQDLSRANLRQAWHHLRAAADPTAPLLTTQPADSSLSDLHAQLLTAADSARQHAVAALIASPFSPEARLAVASFDFAGGDHEQSAALLEQVTQLRARHTDTLLHVGDLAAESADWSFAVSCWRRVVQLNPRLTRQVLSRVHRHANLRADDAIPDQRDALRTAAVVELRQPIPDPALLNRALQALLLPRPPSLSSAEDFRLAARIQQRLDRADDAARTLQLATAQYPRDVALRLDYATSLLTAGKWQQAYDEATIGHRLAPEDKRFEALLQSIDHKIVGDVE